MNKKRYYNLLSLGFVLAIAQLVIKLVYNPAWSTYSFVGLALSFMLLNALRRRYLGLPIFYNCLSLEKILEDFRRRMEF